MPLQKRSKKNTSTEADQEDHYTEEDNGTSLTAEPSQITDQERRAKLEALHKAQAEKWCTLSNHSLKRKLAKKTITL
jgi:organic hydroperoxide reductase OsmC/OhrA